MIRYTSENVPNKIKKTNIFEWLSEKMWPDAIDALEVFEGVEMKVFGFGSAYDRARSWIRLDNILIRVTYLSTQSEMLNLICNFICTTVKLPPSLFAKWSVEEHIKC